MCVLIWYESVDRKQCCKVEDVVSTVTGDVTNWARQRVCEIYHTLPPDGCWLQVKTATGYFSNLVVYAQSFRTVISRRGFPVCLQLANGTNHVVEQFVSWNEWRPQLHQIRRFCVLENRVDLKTGCSCQGERVTNWHEWEILHVSRLRC